MLVVNQNWAGWGLLIVPYIIQNSKSTWREAAPETGLSISWKEKLSVIRVQYGDVYACMRYRGKHTRTI